MVTAAYRKASRWMGWGFALAALGFAGQLGFMYLLSATGWTDRLQGWVIPIGGIPFVIAMILFWRIYQRFNRARVAEAASILHGLGFVVQETPTEAAKVDFCSPIVHLLPFLDLGPGAAGVQWFALEKRIDQPSALFFEHRYTTGSGKSTVEFTRTLMAWPVGHTDISRAVLPQLPWFNLKRRP